MEDFLQLLKDTAVFLLAAQMLMHFLPAKKYEKYGKLMVSMIVLSQLALPILSVGRNDAAGQFWGAFERLEEENEMFSGRLSMLETTGEDMVKSGILQSVEQRVEAAAAMAAVEVSDVRLREDGVVVIEVRKEGEKSPVRIKPVERVAIGKEKTGEASVSADGNALKGSVRADLGASFAEALSMRETAVEVVEIE